MKNKKVPMGIKGRDLTQLPLHKLFFFGGGGGGGYTGQNRLTWFPLYLLGRAK